MGEFTTQEVVTDKKTGKQVLLQTRYGRIEKTFPTDEDFEELFLDLHCALEGSGYLDEGGGDILAKLPKRINYWMITSYSDPPTNLERVWGGIRKGTLMIEDIYGYTWSFLLNTAMMDAIPIGIAPPSIYWPVVD